MTKPQKREKQIGLAPFALKNAPSFIERQFPVGRLSAEAYKERKAIIGQTLTSLGSYWKGRKPLVLVRAVVLGCLLPATDDPAKDLDIFLKLMAMNDEGLARRIKDLKASDVDEDWPSVGEFVNSNSGKPKWIQRFDAGTAERLVADWFPTIPYERRIRYCLRPEELSESAYEGIWPEVNAHIGTNAHSLPELVEQLGVARFGHKPKVADTFCGGGSIPFEAARIGCDVYASDLNPIACMLTWGAFNIIGADAKRRAEFEKIQNDAASAVDAEITKLGIEHDKDGNRAKAYLYCLETRCPKTGWMVPLAPSWIISKSRRTVAKLIPDAKHERYQIEVLSNASDDEMSDAERGTFRDGRLIHPMNPERSGVEIKTVRGDFRDADGASRNQLRPWERTDFIPRQDDVFQERLYCVQWITKDSLEKTRQETFYATVVEGDLKRERQVEQIVAQNFDRWAALGLIPDWQILPGEKTDEPIRTRGWTHWHHLFGPRHLLIGALIGERIRASSNGSALAISFARSLNYMSKLTQWMPRTPTPRSPADVVNHVFYNQALNTFYSYGARAFNGLRSALKLDTASVILKSSALVETAAAHEIKVQHDLGITDPPYADAVNYHEITEFFIAWLRKNPPPPFDKWTWNSQRQLAIKGKDEDFRRAMVDAYKALTRHMPDNGLQVVMFTHQDAGMWADLGAILWAAGLRITGAWNIVTETQSAIKEGNYVQGTICLVLRKRLGQSNARRMDIEAEIEEAVKVKLDQLHAIDEEWRGETLYTDGDLTLAAYAAALEVVTGYSSIDRQPLDRDLYRKLEKGERTMLRDLIDYAESIANNLLVPSGFPHEMWRDLQKSERYYVRMLDMEAKGVTKVADFQSFAKSFAYADYSDLMSSTAANNASLAGAADLKGKMLDGDGFAETLLRKVLFAVWKTIEKEDPKLGVTSIKTELPDYWQLRQKVIALAEYVALKTKHTRPDESAAAHELAEALKVDRV
jgi:putative DNA methylase